MINLLRLACNLKISSIAVALFALISLTDIIYVMTEFAIIFSLIFYKKQKLRVFLILLNLLLNL